MCWHGLHVLAEEDDTQMAWFIERENNPGEYLCVRAGRYIEWTRLKEDALQFARQVDGEKFAVFFFGSSSHGHSIVSPTP